MCIFFLVYYCIRKKFIFAETVSGAIVMALGVFSLNIGPQLSQYSLWYKIFAFFSLTIWAFLMVSYFVSVLTGNFRKLHYRHPIRRFRIGTWIASTSVTVIIISKYFPEFERIVIPLVMLNTLLWLFFAYISFKSIIKLWVKKTTLHLNGVLLLTTVSTQSLVLMYNNVWDQFSGFTYVNAVLIGIGFIFYFACTGLIIRSYMRNSWTLENDWIAPNCILHGALSIIGSAAVISGTFSYRQGLIFWVIVLLLFICLEAAEVVRGVRRVRIYGFRNGLAVYDSSQWARIFTFCMFYTFTEKAYTNSVFSSGLASASQQLILIYGKWVVALLVAAEISLVAHALLRQHVKIRRPAN
jgi:hypothetical protein